MFYTVNSVIVDTSLAAAAWLIFINMMALISL